MPDIEPFDQFLTRTAAAQFETYQRILHASPAAADLDVAALSTEFEKMKKYVADLYQGVKPTKSFFDAARQTIDCIPFDQQPSVRAAKARGIPVKDRMPPPPQIGVGQQSQSSRGVDAPPPAQAPSPPPASPCPPGSVLMKRVTLEDLVTFGTLENYFRKTPLEGSQAVTKPTK